VRNEAVSTAQCTTAAADPILPVHLAGSGRTEGDEPSHRFILGTECDTLHVEGAADLIRAKLARLLGREIL